MMIEERLGQARFKGEEPHNGKITVQNWLAELSTFAEEFQLDDDDAEIDDEDMKIDNEGSELSIEKVSKGEDDNIQAPQADCGIGLVKYDIKFDLEGIAEKHLMQFDRLVNLEKALGDHYIKFEATLLCMKFGREDPIAWLPSAQRMSIRRDIRNVIMRFVDELKLGTRYLYECEMFSKIMRYIDGRSRWIGAENPTEISFIASFVPKEDARDVFGNVRRLPVLPNLSELGIGLMLARQRKQRISAAPVLHK
ncbi:hypothetical protein G7Y89_g2483 [Cudoniella acicularis]|uniref:Uncharacterized protein n=1 Tax=Cudoniella acicularis TaxID=354080 RepID=A0A8H4RT81_9HELO|nr:hypothetical protein G7Y89_g2483 [Cudoniella acicularis]